MSKIIHSDTVRQLAKSGDIIASEITGGEAHMLHMAVGISGEAGELLDAIKKATIYKNQGYALNFQHNGMPVIDRENVVEELGDLEFYMEGLRQGLYITREETLDANIAKLGVRYKHGYSDQAAHDRADKL